VARIVSTGFRQVWAEIDLDDLRANVELLAAGAAPAEVLLVVKADGYGHGAAPVARAALQAGAAWLGVALVEEGAALRREGIDAPIMVLSEPPPEAAPVVVDERLTPVVFTTEGIGAIADAAAKASTGPHPVHLKVDTGMHRVGCAPGDARRLAKEIHTHEALRLEGLMTHLAVADEPANPYTAQQLARFDEVVASVVEAVGEVRLVHAANSAGTLVVPESCHDLVRIGIAAYGIEPAPALRDAAALRAVMALKAKVTFVKDVPAGVGVSYGLHYVTPTATRLATVPIGYADGVPRNLGIVGGEVLVRDRRRRIAGAVTMDQLVVDCGAADGSTVGVGDEVVLLGRQGDEEITATEWAERLGIIAYEVVCGIGPRVPRRYLG
jgi:alanine racemase